MSDVEDGRVFTMHLRLGHRWSDGEPSPATISATGGRTSPTTSSSVRPGRRRSVRRRRAAQVEFPDELTVRYSWSKPNPFFLPALAAATPTFIYMPAHYLK
jgi:peptide/nickel transport system substrate-binding protein